MYLRIPLAFVRISRVYNNHYVNSLNSPSFRLDRHLCMHYKRWNDWWKGHFRKRLLWQLRSGCYEGISPSDDFFSQPFTHSHTMEAHDAEVFSCSQIAVYITRIRISRPVFTTEAWSPETEARTRKAQTYLATTWTLPKQSWLGASSWPRGCHCTNSWVLSLFSDRVDPVMPLI